MYSLDCPYYLESSNTLEELIQCILLSGMDPNYEITLDGIGIGEFASDYLIP